MHMVLSLNNCGKVFVCVDKISINGIDLVQRNDMLSNKRCGIGSFCRLSIVL